MQSSPTTAIASEKEHKGNKEDNFSPYLRSIRQKEERAKNKPEIVRVDELSKVSNRVVFGLKKKNYQATYISNKTELWELLKALAPPDCPSMQADLKSFYKKLEYNLRIKQKNYSKNIKDRYTKRFAFPPPPKKRLQSLMVNLPPRKQKTDASPSSFSCQECQVLKCSLSLSKLQNDLDLKTGKCNDLHSRLDFQKESFKKQRKGAVEISEQIQDF